MSIFYRLRIPVDKLCVALSIVAMLYSSLTIIQATTSQAATVTSYDVQNVPDMRLKVRVTPNQTDDIKVAWPFRNGTQYPIPTTTGGVLEFTQGSGVEHIYYSRAINDSANKVFLLTGTVIRGLNWQDCSQYVSGSDQRTFTPGAVVRLVDDCRLYNKSVKTDRGNVLTASGAVRFTGSGTLQIPVFANGTARDQQIPSPLNGMIIYQTDTGAILQRIAGAWTAVGTATTPNASVTTAGKCQIISTTQFATLTQTGSTGAQQCITPLVVIKNGSGATSANRIPITNNLGVLPISVGGTSRNTFLTGAILLGRGTDGLGSLAPCSANQVVLSDGTRFGCSSAPNDVDVLTGSIASSNTLSGAGPTNFNFTGSISSTKLNTAGMRGQIVITGQSTWSSGSMTLDLVMGGTLVATCTFTPSATGQAWAITYTYTIRSAGASGVIQAGAEGTMGGATNGKSCADSRNTTSFNTTTNKTVNIAFSRSATASATVDQFWIDTYSP